MGDLARDELMRQYCSSLWKKEDIYALLSVARRFACEANRTLDT